MTTRPRGLSIGLLMLLLVAAPGACLAGSVAVQISGIGGKTLENVRNMTGLPAGLIENGKVNEPLLDRFVDDVPARVQKALKPFGYYHATAETRLERVNDDYKLYVAVTEGPPVVLSRVGVTVEGPGAQAPPLLRAMRRFPLKQGDVLREDIYERAKNQLQSRAVDLGYLDADFPIHAVRIWTGENRAEIDLQLNTGQRYFFDGVSFAGGSAYPEAFVRRYLTFKPDDPFSYAQLGESQVNINNSERFRNVLMVADKEDAKDYRVPVRVNLTDAPSRQMRLGGGYGTDTGPRFISRYQDLNVLGKAHEFHSALDISQFKQGIANKYVIPDTKDYRTFTAFTLSYLREDVQTYTTNSASFEIDRERSFGPGRTGVVFLRLLREQSDISGERTTSFLVLPGVRFVAQRYDNLIRPRKGYWLSSEVRGTSTAIGSDQSLLQSVTDAGIIHRLSRSFTFYARGRVGWTVQRESLTDLPASLRFFAGGDKSVRGYAYQSLGPKNADGDVIGGKNLLVGSVELERAIGKDWGIAAFYDAGNAFDDFSRITFYRGAGLGVRYYTRVGPIRLDVARPLDRDAPVVRVHFTVGFGL
jgi:translocation and assembly module TamA